MDDQARTAARRRAAAIATLAATAAALLAPAGALAVSTPWNFLGGTPLEAPNTTFAMSVLNETSSTQTISLFGGTRTIGPGDSTILSSTCGGGPACQELADFSSTTPELVVDAQGVLDNGDGTETGFYLSPASFELSGPDGTEYEAIEALSASQSTGLSGLSGGISTLESGDNALQGLLDPLGGQLGGLSSSLTSLSGQVSGVNGAVGGLGTQVASAASTGALTAKVTALQSQVGTLSGEIATLTKELAPKPAARAVTRRKKAKPKR